MVLVGDYNTNYFKDVKKQSLKTILLPYNLKVQNKEVPNRISRNIFTRSLIADNFTVNSTRVFDNAIFGYHFATLSFLNYIRISKQLSTKKNGLDKKDYKSEQFRQSLYSSNWDKLYQTSDIDVMFDLFTNTFVQALEKHVPIEMCFIRNDKNNFSLSEKKISNTTRQLMINRENFLNYDKLKQFFYCQEYSNTSFSEDYKKIYQKLIEAAESDRKKWLLINEIRNSKKTQPNIICLKNVFNDYVKDPKRISKYPIFWTIGFHY